MSKKRPIGILDSGVGGLTVLKELRIHFPHEDFIYYADTAHVPYGNKTAEQITLYSDNAVAWMIKNYDVKTVVIACHTSSVCCASFLQKKYTIPILDTVQATVQAVMHCVPSSLALLATERTIKKKIHEQALRCAGYQGLIIPQACPDFVPLIEQGIVAGQKIEQLVRIYCEHLKVVALVYGCTHYPFIEEAIKKIVGSNILLINPAIHIATQLKTIIKESDCHVAKGLVQFHVTGDKGGFFAFLSKSHF